ncbi:MULTISPECIES: hypothetical protein [unclassified Rhodococcus (in: high G+C Gram-positive bacteria)]|uniref:hypothetical protein n=1 Tax=unclassified Rhodococcus (in: high G+C Gram-positive bacteria) TaxID=192944 RepID=UPI00146D4ABF|nr:MULTISPECIES: hypothetical protein [unclassified Rhodococcus (in: high G+C Gram-positive bacteria)]MBF0660037.1 hypothetical protein [Rhodococcus sp. (in: high G+C Gram-positive bacteria)]NMD95018.1 hypothetical protein [Rhodococcus sp. BL-253-APC-6A1W]NME78620.1 hypothetical protein [Rhodococcus sp. 105337]
MTALRDRIAAALTPFVQLRTPGAEDNGDGSFGFDYGAVPFALQVVTLTEGLDVVSLTGVLAWDLPLGDEVRNRVATAAEALQFGSIHVIERESVADVIVRYSFPATGLEDSPLTTMLLLVLDGVAEARENVAGTSGTGNA